MTGRRWLLLGGATVLLLLLGLVAFAALEPRATKPSGSEPGCSPRPCTAPGGFELHLEAVAIDGGRVRMQVAFKNNTPAGGFEAVTYRHTSPNDFGLHYQQADHRALVDATCPAWEEQRVERGAAASGPDLLCFAAPPAGLTGAELRWTPDTGVFPVAGSISLDAVPLSATASPSR